MAVAFMKIFFTQPVFLFDINPSLLWALFFGSLALIGVLVISLLIGQGVQKSQNRVIRDLESRLEHIRFEFDSHQKVAGNQELRMQATQKQLDEALKKIKDLSGIFSDQNVKLEQEVRKRTQEIRDANEKLQKVVDELDMFIYKTAHDIRGPLARLMGLTNVALLDVQEPLALDYISKLSKESIHLNNILARLSTIYEINHAELRKEVIRPEEVVRQVVSELEKTEGFKEMKLEIFTHGDLNLISDSKLLGFVLKNLIENAIRFRKVPTVPQAAIRVYFSQSVQYFLIRILDNGIGISPADAMVIFDMFSRAAGVHKTTGLGLYMTKLSVEKLGGTISLITENAGQTEFRIELPV